MDQAPTLATGADGLTVPSISIVLSTYEWPEALNAVLRGFADQSDDDFELSVADDGSGPRTAAVVDSWKARLGNRLAYVRQEDLGFRLARLRNLGAVISRGDYLVFVDGDCIPRPGFVASIRRAALQGWFLATKRVELGSALSHAAIDGHVPVGRRSVALFMLSRSRTPGWIDLTPRDRRRPWRSSQPDFAPDGNAYGCMMAMYRTDFETVNGFDMRYVGWGEEDVDLAVRLRRLGLRCGWAGPQSTLLHLAHESNMPSERPSWWVLQETLRDARIRAITGIDELRTELTPDIAARRAFGGR